MRIFIKAMLSFTVFSSCQHSFASRNANGPLAVELQWAICEKSAKHLLEKLKVKAPESKVRDVFYSETRDQKFFQKGIIFRSRLSENRFKTAAKVKNFSEPEIPWEDLKNLESKCELDSYSGQESIGCTVYSQTQDQASLISKEQQNFVTRSTGLGDFGDLQIWGPVKSQEWEWTEKDFPEQIVIEELHGPHGYHSIELSTRTTLSQKIPSAEKMKNLLTKHDIELCSQQHGRTGELLDLLIELDY